MNFMLAFKLKLTLLAALFGCLIPIIIFNITVAIGRSQWLSLLAALLIVLSGGISLIFVRLLTLRTSPHQTIKKLLLHLFLTTATSFKARSVLPKFLDTLKRPGFFQERILQGILADNANTAYGKDYGLSSMRTIEDFRNQHPLTKYEHYRPYVDRVMNGEDNVMTKARPKCFTRTSGTTGLPKHIPLLDRQAILMNISVVVTGLLGQAIPDLGPLQKRMQFYVHPVTSRSKGGIPIETALTFPADNALLMSIFSTPPAGFTIMTLYEANYIHLLFALRDKYLGIIACNFISLLETMIVQLKDCWRDIIEDIEHGTICSSLKLDEGIRTKLLRELEGRGDPQRARELRQEFERGFQDIVSRVWPHVKVIMGVDPQDVRFRLAKMYTGDIPIYSYVIGASEGLIAVNIWPLEKQLGYVPAFLHNFYEFIPIAIMDEDQPTTLLPEELEVDQCYEIVITHSSGLYRYRMGDVIKVLRFEHATPVFEFHYRKGQVLNFFYEKIDQKCIVNSIQAAVSQWGDVALCNYAVAESTLINTDLVGNTGPYYIFFIELSQRTGEISMDQTRMIDQQLRARGVDYDKLRSDNTIGPPKVHIVRPGSFKKLQEYSVVKCGACEIQYKVPNKLVRKEQLEILMNQVY